jgi:hypothetical protein
MNGTPIVATHSSTRVPFRMHATPGTTYRVPPPPPAHWATPPPSTSTPSVAIATTRAPPGSTRFVPVMRLGALIVAELASDAASRGGEMVYVAQCVDDDEEDGGCGGSSSARCGLEALRCAATARGAWLDAMAASGRASGTTRSSTDGWAEKAYGKPRVVKRRGGKPPSSVSPESASEGGGVSSSVSSSTSSSSSSSSGPTPSEAYRVAGNGRRFPATKPVVGVPPPRDAHRVVVSEKKRREPTLKNKPVGVDPVASRSKAGKPPRSTRREKSATTKSPETPLLDDGARRVVPENPPRLQSKSTDTAKRSSTASSSSSTAGKKPSSTVDRIKTGARKRMLRRRVESVQQSFWEFSAFLSKHARTLDQRGGGGFHDVANAGIIRRLRERIQATQRQRLEHDSVLERMPVPIPPPEHLVGAFDPSLLTKCACPKAETYEMDKDAIRGYDFFAETCPCERCLKTFARALTDRRCACPKCLAKYSETVHANPERRNASGTARKLFEIDDEFEDKWTRIAEAYSGAVGAFTLRRIEQLLDKLKTPILCLPAASA